MFFDCRKPVSGLFGRLSGIAFPWLFLHTLFSYVSILVIFSCLNFDDFHDLKILFRWVWFDYSIAMTKNCFNKVVELCFLFSVLVFSIFSPFSFFLLIQIGSAVGGTTSAFYGFNHGIAFCVFLSNIFMHHVACILFVSKVDIFVVSKNGRTPNTRKRRWKTIKTKKKGKLNLT